MNTLEKYIGIFSGILSIITSLSHQPPVQLVV